MASGAVSGSVTAEFVNRALAGSVKDRLSALVLTDSATGNATWKSQVLLVRSRVNGFMAMLPRAAEIEECLHAFTISPGEEVVMLSAVDVAFETARGRQLGEGPVLIADLPWSYLGLFRKPGRNGLPLVSFQHESGAGRPSLDAALIVAEQWIHDVLDPDTANEYASAFEDGVPIEDAEDEVPSPSTLRAAVPDHVAALQERVAMLEGLVKAQGTGGQTGRGESGLKSSLFDRAPKQTITQAELEHLHRAVGPAPKRLGRAEAGGQQTGFRPDPADDALLAEVDRGVADLESETQVLEQQVLAQLASSSDPLQRLMVLQMRQTQDLVKALMPRQQTDPIAAMLSGSDNGAASSGGGVSVKGYAAREMFLKQLQDDHKLVELIKQNARLELGVQKGREEPSLMKTFLEQRIPIGDHRLLAQFGYMLASGWELGETSQNHQLMAFCGRMMMFVEQSCLDSGRTGLAWLMTGLPEPNFQQLALNKKRSTLTPFAKLAPPTWIAANLSYLKDVDTFDSRLRQLGISKSQNPQTPEGDPEDRNPKPKFKPKKPKGGKGAKGSEAASNDGSNA